ncbi:unnamed protein product [Heligmosomoides polygyrus]|uniref:Helitron_like_N domain-containing protein n=1 Tax=Heligmosomoides polygyrus TaxID=6339 RepID=A0A183FSQ9_HELPZ|nr:unnamed protein product [Heligmosomoides polygyrus]
MQTSLLQIQCRATWEGRSTASSRKMSKAQQNGGTAARAGTAETASADYGSTEYAAGASTSAETQMEADPASGQIDHFRNAFRLLRANDITVDSTLPPVPIGTARAMDEQSLNDGATAHHGAAPDTQGKPPKSYVSSSKRKDWDSSVPNRTAKTEDEDYRHTDRRKRERVAVGDPRVDPLHLLHPCQCGMFNTRAQVGLPGLRSDLARSKPVRNMFELANVASIALHPHWGDDRKEAELLNKESKYLTIHGLATAIQAHSKICYTFVSALKEHGDKELAHPDCFPTSPGYDVELYYRMAMARRTQITSQSPDDMPGNPMLIALPKHFGRVLTDIIEPATVKMAMARRTQITSQSPDDMPGNPMLIVLPKHFGRVVTDIIEPATVKFLVYSHFGDLADQLQKQCISSAFVWVWPNEMQSTQHMLLVQQAVEGHLQCGGTMEFQGFRGQNRGLHNTVEDEVPIKHLAISLGVCPRKGEDRLMAWQCQIFLNQPAHTASGILVLPTFELKQRKPAKQPHPDHPSTSADVPAAEKQKKRQRFDGYYLKDVKKKLQEIAHVMKQTSRHTKHTPEPSSRRRGV